ncbi:MAG: aminotransferase class I/II-fold pyridoxal phosphate-dependent enzyme [bacterium]
MSELRPVPGIERISAYRVPRPPIPVDLRLDGNEGQPPPAAVLAALGEHDPELLRRYPDAARLEGLLAQRLAVPADRLLVTAGADDAFDRICRALVCPGRKMIVPEPTFSMIERFVALSGGELVSIPWPGPRYPTAQVLAALGPDVTAVAVVSPNNPTGAVASRQDVERIAEAAPQALVVIDHAYVEFGQEDLTSLALERPNVVVLRTLSKAWGMAGLRVGYAVASTQVLEWLRIAGHPYAVSGPSLALAARWLARGDETVSAFVAQVARERPALEELLRGAGGRVAASQGNFAFARFGSALWVRDGLAGQGIGVRAFPGDPLLDDAVRLTCPGNEAEFARLTTALRTLFEPEALLFDMDGVLADVSRSYRRAIVETARHYGCELTLADVAAETALGDANNDWVLTRRLLKKRGVDVALDQVTKTFEELYQGTPERPGLREQESLLVPRAALEKLGSRLRLGIVTGRPRADAERFLSQYDIGGCFDAVICMEDAPLKPDPAPVRLALERLAVERAWMLGDTPDDIRAARSAGVLPLGALFQPGDSMIDESLFRAGAARVLRNISELMELMELQEL